MEINAGRVVDRAILPQGAVKARTTKRQMIERNFVESEILWKALSPFESSFRPDREFMQDV
jgi:hypothetical protein